MVLGRFQSVRNEVDEEAAARHGIEIVRRISGGGAMFIEPEGAITWSLYAPESMAAGMTFAESYRFFDAWVVEALRELGIDAWYAPLNDITSAAGKIGGAAQARRGGAVLHHTTIAYDMNLPLMLEVLRIGKEKLSDKGVTSADKRVAPLRQQTNLPREAIIEHMVDQFRRQFGLEANALDARRDRGGRGTSPRAIRHASLDPLSAVISARRADPCTDMPSGRRPVLTPGNRRTYDRLGRTPHFRWKRRRPVLR